MFYERQYENLQPRNVRDGDFVQKKLDSVDWVVPRPVRYAAPTVDQVVAILESRGLKGGLKGLQVSLGNIVCPRSQASMGVVVTHEGKVFTGPKGMWWILYLVKPRR